MGYTSDGAFGLRELHQTGEVGWDHHLLGILVAVAIHLAIIAYAKVNKRRLVRAK